MRRKKLIPYRTPEGHYGLYVIYLTNKKQGVNDMKHITPERFFEILKTEGNVKLYDIDLKEWFVCNGITLNGDYWYAHSPVKYGRSPLRLSDLYEQVPVTMYDELYGIYSNMDTAELELSRFLKKHKSILEGMK
jgi:hypothetical protein